MKKTKKRYTWSLGYPDFPECYSKEEALRDVKYAAIDNPDEEYTVYEVSFKPIKKIKAKVVVSENKVS